MELKSIQYLWLILVCLSFTFCSTPDKNQNNTQLNKKNIDYIEYQLNKVDSLKKQSKLANAIQVLDSIIITSNNTNNYKLYHLLNNKASTLATIGEEVKALNLFQESIDIARQEENKQEEFKALANIGILNSRIDNLSKSLEIFNEAIDFYNNELTNKEKKHYSLSPIYNSKGGIFLKRKKLDSAFLYFKLSIKGESHPIAKNAFYNNASTVFKEKGEYDSAHIYIDRAIEFSLNQKSDSDLTKALIHKSEIFITEKKLVDALKTLEKAKKILDTSHFQINSEFKEAVLKYYLAKKEFKNAYALQDEINLLKKEARTIEKNRRVENLTLLYDLEGKKEKIKELQFEDELNTIRINNRNTFIILTLLAITILSVLIYQYAKKNKHIASLNKNLVTKNLALVNSQKEQSLSNNYRVKDSKKSDSGKSFEPNDEIKQELIEKLEAFSNDRTQVCDTNITLAYLAKKFNTNQKYLSSVINKYYNCNFSTFLNERRIGESCLMLTEEKYKNYSIEAISNEAGFSSKSAFNKAFKKYTGLTPTVFLKYRKTE